MDSASRSAHCLSRHSSLVYPAHTSRARCGYPTLSIRANAMPVGRPMRCYDRLVSATASRPPDQLLAVARSLSVDHVTAEVVRSLRDAGVRPILLKGPTIARALYDDGSPRSYVDTDLLVAPERVPLAEHVLATLGFECLTSPREDARLRAASRPWLRGADLKVVDLHWTLPGAGVLEGERWSALKAQTEVTSVNGVEVEGLAPAGLALHVALHAARPGAGAVKAARDLERGLERLDRSAWWAAADLARQLEAVDSFVAGLTTVSSGAVLAAELGLPPCRSREALLFARGAPRFAAGIEGVVSTPGVRSRLVLLARALVPSVRFMRSTSLLARRGRRGLAAAYALRPALMVAGGLPALRAWVQVWWETRMSSASGRGLAKGCLNLATARAACWALLAARRARSELGRNGLDSTRLPRVPRLPDTAYRGVGVVLRVGSFTCLEQATVRQAWYAARGERRDVVIAVRSGEDGFEAHAWLEGDRVSADPPYKELHRLSAR
jgi:hypothetical protein